MKRIVLAAVLISTMWVPIGARADSCVALALPTGGSCQYIATGPGVFQAATANHWRIYVYRGATIVASTGNGSFPSATPTSGTLPTIAGDRVVIGIDNAWAGNPEGPPLGARVGFVQASDA